MGRHKPRSEQQEGSASADARAAEAGARAGAEFARLAREPLAPGLYVVATPIGNLGDITLRALAVLARAHTVYCEDTRTSRTLLARYGIGATLVPYHEHNAEEQRPRVLGELGAGKAVALVSDAGTPLVSDPGWKLVREAVAAGHAVVAIPGPCAPIAAIAVAGLPTDSFFFAGFLPAKAGARRTRIGELAQVPGTLIFFEAPSRVAAALDDLAAVLGPRPAAVARELTKLHEEIRRGPLDELRTVYDREQVRGEVVILVGPPLEAGVGDATIEEALDKALSAMSVRDAARVVAEALSISKARVYDLALKLQRGK
jgi:16S rRNA (cytidine1402-2'-O)-methyltransferase